MAHWRNAADAIVTALAPPCRAAVLGINSSNDIRCYVGWPDPKQLNRDLRSQAIQGNPAQIAHIAIYPLDGSRLSSRYNKEPTVIKFDPTESVVVALTGQHTATVTLSGTPTAGDNVFIIVNGVPFQTTSLVSDTLNAIATRLAAAITAQPPAGVTASASGPVVTLGGVFGVFASAYGFGVTLVEVARTTRRYQVSVFTLDNIVREALLSAITETLAAAEFLTIVETRPQGTFSSLGRVLYESAFPSDFGMPAGLMTGFSHWQVEYPVFVSAAAARVGAVVETITPVTPMQQVLGVVGQPLVITSGVQIINLAGASKVLWKDDLTTGLIAVGGLPTATFQLSHPPTPNGELGYVNGSALQRVGASPQVNQYTISGQTVTLWRAMTTNDYVLFVYEL